MAVMRLETTYKGDAPFKAIAAKRIFWEILEYQRSWRRRQEHVKAMAAPDGPLVPCDVPVAEGAHDATDAKDAVAALLALIDDPRHRCALGLMAAGYTQGQAGAVVGLTGSRLSQLMTQEWRPLALAIMG